MKIGMILAQAFPPDIRVEKETVALCEAGFEVELLCQQSQRGQSKNEVTEYGLTISREDVHTPGTLVRFGRWLALERYWIREEWMGPVRRFVEESHPEVLHCHDLPMVPTVLAVAADLGIPVVADLHENTPALFEASSRRSPLKHMMFVAFRNYDRWCRVEADVLPLCKRVIVVVSEARDRVVNIGGISPKKVVEVSNTEDESTFRTGCLDQDIACRYRGQWVAVYVGGAGPHRGIDTAIRAAALVGPTIKGFRLLIVGVRPKDGRSLEKLVKRCGASQYVELVNWVPSDKVASYVALSRVCLVPHNNYRHTQTTVPHKLFQYMMMRKPVVVSSCAPLKRIVEETQSGRVFLADDPESLAGCLTDLAGNSLEQLAAFGNAGYEGATGPYAWRHDGDRLVSMYRALEAEESFCT